MRPIWLRKTEVTAWETYPLNRRPGTPERFPGLLHSHQTDIMTHGHDVLHMMEGHTSASKAQLVEAIIARFGAAEKFCTCHAEDLSAGELVDFLEAHGKFMPARDDGFTVNTDRICNH